MQEAVLKSISHSVNTSVKNTHSGGLARANYEMDYSNGIKELNSLINHLEKYDVFFYLRGGYDNKERI